jgi:hypothetical protein
MDIKSQYKGKMFILLSTLVILILTSNLKSESHFALWPFNYTIILICVRTAVPLLHLVLLRCRNLKEVPLKKTFRFTIWLR